MLPEIVFLRRIQVPVVDLKLAGELSESQKSELSQKITSVISEVTGKSESSVYIFIQDAPRSQWAVGGKLLSEGSK